MFNSEESGIAALLASEVAFAPGLFRHHVVLTSKPGSFENSATQSEKLWLFLELLQ